MQKSRLKSLDPFKPGLFVKCTIIVFLIEKKISKEFDFFTSNKEFILSDHVFLSGYSKRQKSEHVRITVTALPFGSNLLRTTK